MARRRRTSRVARSAPSRAMASPRPTTNVILVAPPRSSAPARHRSAALRSYRPIARTSGKRGGMVSSASKRSISANTIAAAIPGTALMLTGLAVASRMLDQSPMIRDLKKKTPGGGNTLALGVGVALGYLGYKYRYLAILLSGLGLAAYALIKFGTKEAKFTYEEGYGTSESTTPSAESTTPSAPSEPVLPSKVEAANNAFEAGDSFYKAGDYKSAIKKYEEALSLTNNKIIYFSLGQCYRKLAEAQGPGASAGPTPGQKLAKTAIFYFDLFMLNAEPSAEVDAATLAKYKQFAKELKQELSAKFFSSSRPEDQSSVTGVTLDVSGDDDDDDDVEGDDDEDDVEGDDEGADEEIEVEGDYDDEDD